MYGNSVIAVFCLFYTAEGMPQVVRVWKRGRGVAAALSEIFNLRFITWSVKKMTVSLVPTGVRFHLFHHCRSSLIVADHPEGLK